MHSISIPNETRTLEFYKSQADLSQKPPRYPGGHKQIWKTLSNIILSTHDPPFWHLPSHVAVIILSGCVSLWRWLPLRSLASTYSWPVLAMTEELATTVTRNGLSLIHI